jgi:hypothetical protein
MKALVLVLLTACSDDVTRAENPGAPDAHIEASPDGGPDPGCDVPTTGIRAYLERGEYRQFPAEPAVHASAGPHGGNVRTYVSPSLDVSLKAASTEHPRCAAAIKELYGSGTSQVTGWAVAVKTGARSEGGAGWYWYEVLSTREGAAPVADGNGVSLCTGCHSGGSDFVLTPPLR